MSANLHETRWENIAYLQQGSPIQKRAHACLIHLGILATLRDYDAILAGTVPLDLATADSDLDILCEVHDQLRFCSTLEREYGGLPEFSVRQIELPSGSATLGNFTTDGFDIQVFGQPLPVREQHAYRHMEVEHRLMLLGGDRMKTQITQLKSQGFKTEPAFAVWLGLKGDPHGELLKLSGLTGEELSSWYYATIAKTRY